MLGCSAISFSAASGPQPLSFGPTSPVESPARSHIYYISHTTYATYIYRKTNTGRIDEDDDIDADGVDDSIDACKPPEMMSIIGTSSITLWVDYDGDGCHDLEDDDIDGDCEGTMSSLRPSGKPATLTAFLVKDGDLAPIQAAAQLCAGPFAVVLLLMAISLPVRLRHQVRQRRI